MSRVEHRPDEHRFVVETEEGVAELVYRMAGDTIVFEHTRVPDEMEGEGVGSSLVKAGLGYAEKEDLAVRPDCPFVRAYIEEHEELHHLLKRD